MSVCRPCVVRQESVFARVKSVASPCEVRNLSVARPSKDPHKVPSLYPKDSYLLLGGRTNKPYPLVLDMNRAYPSLRQ